MTFPARDYLQPSGAGSAAGSPPSPRQARQRSPHLSKMRGGAKLENVTYTWVIFNFLSFPYTVKLPPAYLSG